MAAQDARGDRAAERARADGAAAGIVRPRVAADGGEPARRARPRRLDSSAGRADPPHAVARLARVRRRARRAIAPSSAATATAASISAARSGASRCTPSHDGVVDRVQRGANPKRTAATTCASPIATAPCSRSTSTWRRSRAGSQPGTFVKAGDVIGLLGDTGVKESAPHLHFAVSVRPATDWPERYIDPEPLIALWPLRIPIVRSPRRAGEHRRRAGVLRSAARPPVRCAARRSMLARPRHEPASEPPSESSE